MDTESGNYCNLPHYDHDQDEDRLLHSSNFRQKYFSKTFWWEATKTRLPIVEWLPRYEWKHNLLPDVLAGVTLAIINVAQGLSFAILAQAPMIFGLYTACFSPFVYSLLGTAVVSAFGPATTSSMLTGEALAEYMTSQNMSAQPDGTPEDEQIRSEYIATLSFTSGLIYAVLFLLNLSVIRLLFTKAFVSGFISGCCVQILSKTIKMVIKVNVTTHYGYAAVVYNLKDLVLNVPNTHIPTLILSIVVTVILLLNTYLLKKLVAKVTTIIIPMEGVVLVFSVIVSYYFEFKKMGFQEVDKVPAGLPQITPMNPALLMTVFPQAVTISMITLALMLSTVIPLNPGVLNPRQELLAIACSNLICSNLKCLIMNNSLLRSFVAMNLGIKSQLATIISSAVMLVVLLFAGPLFKELPVAVLGCIIVITGAQILVKNIIQYPEIFKTSVEDGLIWLIVFAATVFINVNTGLMVGFVLTLRQHLVRVYSD